MKYFLVKACLLLSSLYLGAQNRYTPSSFIWNSMSKNAEESMPCGGGDIGLNVWVENGDLLFYIAKSGFFDENNSLLKAGRVRIQLSPNPFVNKNFKQELDLAKGQVVITGQNGALKSTIKLWVNVYQPEINVEIQSNQKTACTASYESWRYENRLLKGKENNQNSWKWAPQGRVYTYRDHVNFDNQKIVFYHANRPETVFDATVRQQGLESIKDSLYNPLKNQVFGGAMAGTNMISAGISEGSYLNTPYKAWHLSSSKPSTQHQIKIVLHQSNDLTQWKKDITNKTLNLGFNQKNTLKWWANFWNRSFIEINSAEKSESWQMGRNYQLFRFMLACNAYGKNPTKFNGGLFTYDPVLTDSTLTFTPDFRNWGGGTHTAQNQRLVYWPMLASGDFDMMSVQFSFYLRAQKNAELRSQFYWGHPGACFTEQLENFGLPNPAEYNWKRPLNYDKGMQYNAWLEYEWDTVLEFCMMMLEQHHYTSADITAYIPFIESCLTFFSEHYQYLAKQRGSKAFDSEGHLVLYPGSAAETYKMAYNASPTISGLRTVLESLLKLPAVYLTPESRKKWEMMLQRIPPISYRSFEGKTTIAPARLWERVNNVESPQLYPVYPWKTFGIGKPGLDTAINTFFCDSDVVKFRSHTGWKQDNIFAARLGLTQQAFDLTVKKLKDSGRRFPAYWGPGFDWTPDHNWGGSGMIGLQEMLLQTNGNQIYLFPSWPKNVDVHFKLHAPYQTTVEAELKDGKVNIIAISPHNRAKDIVNFIK